MCEQPLALLDVHEDDAYGALLKLNHSGVCCLSVFRGVEFVAGSVKRDLMVSLFMHYLCYTL